ncbi:MAG: zinc-dependent metalloprotease [Acidimicrobiales bacterium]|jgi:putative hydrolase|nr:zinc-dependent metalloprotease [Acidimicrobiales bacterium]MDP6298196.1 zinc-dependent metalloprotease [Acidimicrobiales bacterium]HJM28937.1 zinc-dependent metalloprotease [Acidimicrobiales bacterium]HJM97787.1 zinc-dependent metalloprotease [Acidimicrobiales bacterium]
MENNNPFGEMPFFGDFEKLFSAGGQDPWETAKQIAIQMAGAGSSTANVDPSHRIALDELCRIAQLHVANATTLGTGDISVHSVTRTEWANATIEAYKPLFESLTEALTQEKMDDSIGGDPMNAMFEQMMQFLGPIMLSMTAGSMVGHLAQRSFGQFDLPIPRQEEKGIQIITNNVADFGKEWSLPIQELLLWVCLHEFCFHAVLRIDHVHARVTNLLFDYVSGFESNPSGLEEKLQQIDMSSPSALEELQRSLGSPEVILGAIQSEAQLRMLPELNAVIAVIVGYVDYIMDSIGNGLIGSYNQITEAMRRQRVEAGPSDRFIERMLGLELTQDQYDRGGAFVQGVVERSATSELTRLWSDPKNFPTPNEVDAPGLWLARIDLPE